VNGGVAQDIIPGETEALWLKVRWLAATAPRHLNEADLEENGA
jgi:hypothetical protein